MPSVPSALRSIAALGLLHAAQAVASEDAAAPDITLNLEEMAQYQPIVDFPADLRRKRLFGRTVGRSV
jgi:hypothetical protein